MAVVYVEEDAIRHIVEEVPSLHEDLIRNIMQYWWQNQERFTDEAPIDPQSGLPDVDGVELILRELPHAGRGEISLILDAEWEYLRSIGLIGLVE